MRVRIPALVVTFAQTADAIAAEDCLKKLGVPGRLIPIPPKVRAGCGLAWKAKPEEREAVLGSLEKNGLHWQDAAELELWSSQDGVS